LLAMNDFGVRVFPSSSSNAIRNSGKVLHYSPAPADPPIDYTLRVKPNSNAVPTIPWKPGHKSTSAPQQHVNNWSKQRQSSAENSNLRRYSAENGPAAVEKFRDTVEESASVLEDLDHLLDSEELTLQQRMSRLEIRRGQPLPNSIPIAAAAKEREEKRYSHQIPVKSNFRLRRGSSTETSPTEPVPLRPQRPQRRIAPQRVSSYGEDVSNERRKSMVEDMYKETERRIDEAIQLYTPEYFKQRMTLSPTLPLWKCELMARKLSNETIEKIQEDAWRDFAEWKRLHAPSITIQPTWRNKRQPMLP
ncbi:hypothetical protein V3C99_011871, partial [Haemonchus contortus]